MQITTFSDYCLRILIALAINDGKQISARNISERYGISTHHVAKASQWLVHQGHITATRGKGGGLKLARHPDNIKIGNVIGKAERGTGLVECMRGGGNCTIDGPCGLTGILAEAQAAFFDTLNQYSLSDAIRKKTRLAKLLQFPGAG